MSSPLAGPCGSQIELQERKRKKMWQIIPALHGYQSAVDLFDLGFQNI